MSETVSGGYFESQERQIPVSEAISRVGALSGVLKSIVGEDFEGLRESRWSVLSLWTVFSSKDSLERCSDRGDLPYPRQYGKSQYQES